VVLALARSYGLTAYDAAYLELALRRGAALATFDPQLAGRCAKLAGGCLEIRRKPLSCLDQ